MKLYTEPTKKGKCVIMTTNDEYCMRHRQEYPTGGQCSECVPASRTPRKIPAAKPPPKREARSGIAFGTFALPLIQQLRGVRIPAKIIRHAQIDADAVTRLRLRSMLTDGEASRARDRIASNLVNLINARSAKKGGRHG